MTLLTTKRLFWHCGAHIAKPESALDDRFLIAEICCFLWHVALRRFSLSQLSVR